MSRWSPSLSLLALACARTEPGTADELPACHPVTIDAAVCDPAVATFTLASNNPWYPLEVGQVTELEGVGTGDEEGIVKRVVRTVLPDLRTILGTETHILRHETYWDGVIHEVAMNFYVETTDGNVCYFGEDVEFYDTSGVFQNTQGTWKAGENDALPGVIMPANPQVGDAYYQEMSPGIALDQGRIAQEGLVTELDGASYPTLQIMDTNPIDDETPCAAEEKRYAAGIGERIGRPNPSRKGRSDAFSGAVTCTARLAAPYPASRRNGPSPAAALDPRARSRTGAAVCAAVPSKPRRGGRQVRWGVR